MIKVSSHKAQAVNTVALKSSAKPFSTVREVWNAYLQGGRRGTETAPVSVKVLLPGKNQKQKKNSISDMEF